MVQYSQVEMGHKRDKTVTRIPQRTAVRATARHQRPPWPLLMRDGIETGVNL